MYAVWKGEWIRGSGLLIPPRPKPWVARITGKDPRWKYKREFLAGVYDYSRVTTRRAGRGIYLYFFLAPGIYELFAPISWKHEMRYFARVNSDGELVKITEEELCKCLNTDLG